MTCAPADRSSCGRRSLANVPLVFDAQIHVWRADRADAPWAPDYRERFRDRPAHLLHTTGENAPDSALVEMAEAGIDRAVIVPVGVYGQSHQYELNVAQRYPRRFSVMGLVDPGDPDAVRRLGRDVELGLSGVRITALRDPAALEAGQYDAILQACQTLGLPVATSVPHPVFPAYSSLFKRWRGITFFLDHLALGVAPPVLGHAPVADLTDRLRAVASLSENPNCVLKLTGAPSLSLERYPFADIHPLVLRLIELFGVERVVWGSDCSRTRGLHSTWEAVHYLTEVDGLSDSERAALYGGNLARILDR